jgi:putative FmdB family regulatory protein
MPIYEFVCESCDHEFERILSFSAVDLPACPACEASSVRRRLSKPAIHFKGSGWYITDSKKGNGSSSSETNGSAKSVEKEGSSESTSETTKSEATKSDAAKSEPVKSEAAKSDAPKTESSSAKSSVKTEA